jgi:hypothetical protein
LALLPAIDIPCSKQSLIFSFNKIQTVRWPISKLDFLI